MNIKKSPFVGAAGTYYVMSRLAYECVHASATFGNAPYIDIVASSEKGDKQISIQVKTADFARRGGNKRNGWKWSKLDWALSYKAASLNMDNLFFVFVDIGGEKTNREQGNWQPTVYIIPSKVLATEFCSHWTEAAWRLQIDINRMEPWKEKWDLIKDFLYIPKNETVIADI